MTSSLRRWTLRCLTTLVAAAPTAACATAPDITASPSPSPSPSIAVASPFPSPSPPDALLARQCDAVKKTYTHWQDVWLPGADAIEKASPAQRTKIAGAHLDATLSAIEAMRQQTSGARSEWIRQLSAGAAVFTVRISEIILSFQKTGTWTPQAWNDLHAAANQLALDLNAVRNTCPGGMFGQVTPAASSPRT